MSDQPYHIPALLEPTIDALNINPSGIYVDCTLGGGGHSRAILARLGPQGRLLCFDQDTDALERAQADPVLGGDPRVTLVHGNFRYLKNFLRFYDAEKVDGILADLGVSFHHFDDPDRGFSFRWEGPLDMRMNRQASTDAASLLAAADIDRLTEIFRLYGELKNANRLATTLVAQRRNHPLQTTGELAECVRPLLPPAREKKDLAKVFQALRIAVNHEMEALQEMLKAATELLAPGGRLVVLTYHSLEDRLVKNFMRAGNADGRIEQDFYGNRLAPLRPVNNKVILPDDAEQEANPRSRSAKLRIAVKPEANSK